MDTESTWPDQIQAGREIDAEDIDINAMGQGLSGADAHIQRLEKFRPAAGL